MVAMTSPMPPTDREKNRFSARARRYASVGTRLGGTAARFAGARFFGVPLDRAANALELAAALGGLKGPIMKVAQLLATIPDALPPEYTNELIKLQSQAPPMGWAFVKRRMSAELGPDWQKKFSEFEHHPAAAPILLANCSTLICSRRWKLICASCSCSSPFEIVSIRQSIRQRLRSKLA